MRMNINKQILFLAFSFVALVLVCAMAWVSPFLEVPQISSTGTPQERQSARTKLSGTVVREGAQFVLHNASGIIYKLADGENVGEYESLFVLVTGQLDEKTNVLHVEKISSYSL